MDDKLCSKGQKQRTHAVQIRPNDGVYIEAVLDAAGSPSAEVLGQKRDSDHYAYMGLYELAHSCWSCFSLLMGADTSDFSLDPQMSSFSTPSEGRVDPACRITSALLQTFKVLIRFRVGRRIAGNSKN